MTKLANFDVIVVGAGLAGLTCARILQQQGLKVLVLDKSKGLGGRVATRRVGDIPLDHGLPCLEVQGPQTENLIASLPLLQPWLGDSYQITTDGQWELLPTKRWCAPQGMTAIAKYLAQDLTIQGQTRVTKLTPFDSQTWSVVAGSEPWYCRAMVLAIPAPQALEVLSPDHPLRDSLAKVQFDPCLTVMAAYQQLASPHPWTQLTLSTHSHLRKVILDSSKRSPSPLQTLVVHSTPSFAQIHLDAEALEPLGRELLNQLPTLGLTPSSTPEWFQVHRWRYAFPRVTPELPYLSSQQPLPLICCGDWCSSNLVEGALYSGQQAAQAILSLV